MMVYCRYQTGALTPLMRWISQAMHRAAAPPRQPRPVARVDPVVGQGNNNVVAAAAGNLLFFSLAYCIMLGVNC